MKARPLARAATAAAAALALAAGVLVGAPSASAAAPVENVRANPVPPERVSISWDAFTAFTVDHYEVRVQPGSGYYPTDDGDDTNVLIDDLGWGTKYTVTVQAVGTVGQESEKATLVLPGMKLRASLVKVHAVRGTFAKITGTLTDHANQAIKGARIQLQSTPTTKRPPLWRNVKTTTTAAKGAFAFRTKAKRNTIYRVLYDAPNTAGGWDSNMVLSVHVPISLRFASPVRFGQPVRFHGKLDAPAALVAGAKVKLQEKVGGRWQTRRATNVGAQGKYSIVHTPASQVNHAWRIFTQAGPDYATSTSTAKVLIVH